MTESRINSILTQAYRLGASDVHLTAGLPPMVRINGTIQELPGHDKLSSESISQTVMQMLTQRQKDVFERNLELDFAYSIAGLSRFRGNLYVQRNSVGAAFRIILQDIRGFADLELPAAAQRLAEFPRGLVLVTGPAGSGKSTTIAALIDSINSQHRKHIITIEDPIEFMHRHKQSIVNQREIGSDTVSFAGALKHALRQDPDVIVVGELRDLESTSIAITAAETGHLVIATLHTQDSASTVDRIVDMFPTGQQQQVRSQLSNSLRGVIAQTLLNKLNTNSRVPATELLFVTPAAAHLIREGKTHQLQTVLQSGGQLGMHSMNQSLAGLVNSGMVSYDEAKSRSNDQITFEALVKPTPGRDRFNNLSSYGYSDIPDSSTGLPTERQ